MILTEFQGKKLKNKRWVNAFMMILLKSRTFKFALK